MNVLPFAVSEVADLPCAIEPPHLLVEDHVRVVLREHVDLAAALHRADERDALGQRLAGRRLGHHVLSRVQGLDRERRVLMEVVRENDRIHVVREELVVVGVGLHAQPRGDVRDSVLPHVAERHELHADSLAGARREPGAAPDADDTHPDGLGHTGNVTSRERYPRVDGNGSGGAAIS